MMNALHQAAFHGSTERVVALLATGLIDIDEGGPAGMTPLMAAARQGHSHLVRLLLGKGANVSISSVEDATALRLSAEQGHLAITRMLVKARADLDAADFAGHTPLHSAAGEGHWLIVRFLVDAGANVNNRSNAGSTPLYLAAQNGHLQAARQLLRVGADPLLATKSRSADGETALPLDVAALAGQDEMVHELIQQVGIEGCGGATAGWNALDMAAKSNHVGVIAVLVDAGVVDTGIALNHACLWGSEAAANFLVQQRRKVWGASRTRGAYVDNVFRPFGYTPLASSFFGGRECSPRIARLLVDAGADTTFVVRIIAESGLVANGTPLALTNRCLRDKEIAGKAATEEKLFRLEAVRRMLLRVAAIHAVSWLWPAHMARIGHSAMVARKVQEATEANGMARGTMLPLMRRRAGRRGMVWATLFRHSSKP